MRALLDTNIVFDMLRERPFDQDGLMKLRVMLAFGDVELWVSSKSYADLFYVVRKEIGSAAAQDLLEDTAEWLKICSVDGDDVRGALFARWQDFEDRLVNECAGKIEADFIITRDEKGFRSSKIPNGTASEFMDYVHRKTGIEYSTENFA